MCNIKDEPMVLVCFYGNGIGLKFYGRTDIHVQTKYLRSTGYQTF